MARASVPTSPRSLASPGVGGRACPGAGGGAARARAASETPGTDSGRRRRPELAGSGGASARPQPAASRWSPCSAGWIGFLGALVRTAGFTVVCGDRDPARGHPARRVLGHEADGRATRDGGGVSRASVHLSPHPSRLRHDGRAARRPHAQRQPQGREALSGRRYVSPVDPTTAVRAPVRVLDGQSLIRSAYEVRERYRSSDGEVWTENRPWFHVAGCRRPRVAHRAVRGVGGQLMPILRGPAVGWSHLPRRMVAEAGSSVRVLQRAPDPRPRRLEPVGFELRWLPVRPPRASAAAASAVREGCPGMPARSPDEGDAPRGRRAGAATPPHPFRVVRPQVAAGDSRAADGARQARVARVRRRPRAGVPAHLCARDRAGTGLEEA
jgi:hypothetical protein